MYSPGLSASISSWDGPTHTRPRISRKPKSCATNSVLDRCSSECRPGSIRLSATTGWQLSQGERGRVFLARALLQNAEVVILDESLGALDPQNFQQCLDCVTRRAKTLLVVAHP